MLIGSLSFEQAVQALASAEAILGREINPTIFSAQELSARLVRQDSFLVDILKKPKIFLIGDEDRLMKRCVMRLN
jgi:hypothetical protein